MDCPFSTASRCALTATRGTGLTKSDYEKTFTNIGTGISQTTPSMIRSSLRNALRYSHVDRHADPSIPAVTCSNVTCNGPAAIVTGVTRSRPERDTQESILSNQTDLTAKFDTYSFKHILTTGLEVGRETFDQLRWASAGPATTLSDPNNNQLPAAKTVSVKQDTLRDRIRYLCRRPDQAGRIFRHRRRAPLGLLQRQIKTTVARRK